MVGACEAVGLSHAAVQGADGRPCAGNGGNAKGTCAGHGCRCFSFLHANGVLSFSVMLFGFSRAGTAFFTLHVNTSHRQDTTTLLEYGTSQCSPLHLQLLSSLIRRHPSSRPPINNTLDSVLQCPHASASAS